MQKEYIPQKSLALLLSSLFITFIGIRLELNTNQLITIVAFSVSILGTLLFWEFRLSFAFLGSTIILFARIVTLGEFLRLSSIEIIFFLIGMMVLVGFLKEIGFFDYLMQRALIIRHLSSKRLLATLVFVSALLACVVDEVSSILLMIMIILEICDYFEIRPIPFIVASVLATNIGSAGTVIGNPIGLLIATRAQLTFEDFTRYAFPLMLSSLLVLIGLLLAIFKNELAELDEKIRLFGANEFLVRLLSVPPGKRLRLGFVIFGATLLLIAMHHRLEVILHLETNTILLIAPLFASSIIMLWRRHSARNYIERDVEWWTLLFFVFLFAQAGVVAKTGVAEALADKLLSLVSGNKILLIATILFGGAIISSVLDNIVVVTAFIPIVASLKEVTQTQNILWWALLFGACFGGNITSIGSTANIMAIGNLEKLRRDGISFLYWLKIGLLVGLVTISFVFILLLIIPYYK